VKEEEVYPPANFPVSIAVCETEFVETVDDIASLKKRIENRLIERYSYGKIEGRRFREGFLQFEDSSNNTIECFFAKETPTKINYEADDLKIHTERMRLLNPSYSVRMKIAVNKEGARVILYGGSDSIIAKAMNQVNYCIRHHAKGGHRTVMPSFSRQDMNTILKNFGLTVEYIWIHPGESKKFIKIVKKKVKGEVKEVTEYIVHAKLRGYRITGSPITIGLVEESGVYLREIQGRLHIAPKINVTARVSAEGRVLFYIPESLVGREETIYDVAERLYKRIITQREGPKQTTMGEYFVEEN